MAEFNVVAHAKNSPTECLICGDFAGPFIDAYIELPGHGHVYICGPSEARSGCVGQMASQFGYLPLKARGEIEASRDAAEARVLDLEQELAMFKQLKDVQAFLRKRQARTLQPTEEVTA